MNPLKRGTDSNLVDAGRAAAHASSLFGLATPKPVIDAGGEATVNACGVAVGEAVGAELGADPVDRYMVNLGTVLVSPFPASSQLVGGQVLCRLMTLGWGGGFVVVRALESRAHGEGTQRVRSEVAGMSGGHR